MDPVSAVGVAAAAVQFLDASIKAYNIFQEVRGSPRSTTERNQQLENNIRAAQDLRASLVSSSKPQGAADPVSKLVDVCESKAKELLDLLEYIRGTSAGAGSMGATIRALRKKGRVEKLHTSLKEDREALSHMIQDKLLPSIDLLKVQQTAEFAALNSIAQRLVKELVEQRKAQEDNQAALIGRIDDVYGQIQRRFEDADRSKERDALLKSLWFPEIDLRQKDIRGPAQNTLGWLFEPKDSVPSARPWSNFRQWLREETSMYWISGKAGSGKSTLMAHIIDDERTLEELDVWRDGRELKILTFFFWRAGSKLQTSIMGLLRSLLHQLCQLQPAIADEVLSCLESRIGIPAWTESSLCRHITKAIKSADRYRFCIFIDGLDEFQDQRNTLDDLVDHLDRLQDLGNVKVCVSSRPELEFIHRLRGLKQLRLQDLNAGDIRASVQQSLAKAEMCKDDRAYFADRVVERANGVFLWAALVAKDLIKGSRALDSRAILEERLDSLPGDMDKLFAQMLSNVDPVYQKSLALYVQLLLMKPSYNMGNIITIASIVAMQSGQQINSYEEFAEECARTETRITTESAGLLEVSEIDLDNYLNQSGEYIWRRTPMKFVSDRQRFVLQPTKLDRRRCAANEPYTTMLVYEERRIKWIHRSAFEFFSDPNKRTLLPLDSSLDSETLCRKFYESYVGYIAYAPSVTPCYRFSERPTTSTRLGCIFYSISGFHEDQPELATRLLDNLFVLHIQFDFDETVKVVNERTFDGSTVTIKGEAAFWTLCAFSRLFTYMALRVDRIIRDIASEADIGRIISRMCEGSSSIGALSESKRLCLDHFMAHLLYLTDQRLKTSNTAHAERNRYYSYVEEGLRAYTHAAFPTSNSWRASWSKQIALPAIWAMTYLAPHLIYGLQIHQMNASLSTLMEITNFYIGPCVGFRQIFIQLASRIWSEFRHSLADSHEGVIGAHISAARFHRAVRIMCVPLQDKPTNYAYGPGFVIMPPSDVHQFICLHPSGTVSGEILNLLRYEVTPAELCFSVVLDPQKRQDVGEMLLQEIESGLEGLEEDERLIASNCVRAGFLGAVTYFGS